MNDPQPHFRPALFGYLRDLSRNNRRDWFKTHKSRYEDQVRDPALRFISDFGPALRQISPHFRADPRPVGGSMFRIHRDIRFSQDKSPYKTHVGIQFRHKLGRGAHSPGFYLHLEPGGCFAGCGIWHPDGATLAKIRSSLVTHPDRWQKVVGGRSFRADLELSGDRLKRAPRGFDVDHPLIEDLKRKDFVAIARLDDGEVTSPDFLTRYARLCHSGAPLVRFLCEAVEVPF